MDSLPLYKLGQHRGRCLAYRAALPVELNIFHVIPFIHFKLHLDYVSAEWVRVSCLDLSMGQGSLVSRVAVVVENYFGIDGTHTLNTLPALSTDSTSRWREREECSRYELHLFRNNSRRSEEHTSEL